MKELKIEQWPVERLRPYGRELKVTDKALPQMVDALRQWGFRIPLLVTGDGEIVDGKTRYRAALELRMETVPVIVADDLTPTQVRTFRLLVNRSATWADWNDEALRAEMAELRLELDDLRLTGFADKELDIFLQGAVADSEKDPDDAPPVPETPTCKLGDVWQLGIHRLMCGDSTKAADVVTLMSGEQADMVWTDPPYNVDYSSKAGKIKNDKMSPEQFDGFLRRLLTSAADVLVDGGAIYV
ncbi:MAG: ParB N-terminal domain-containing protein, partial [Bilophila wadsworthia]